MYLSLTLPYLQEIYEAETTPFLADFKSHFNHIRYTYLTQLLSLEKAKQEHEANLEKLRRQREQMFPQSTEEWASKPHDVRLRVARFLVADDTRKEKFMSDFGWAWRQVTPLVEEFKKNVSSFLISFVLVNVKHSINLLNRRCLQLKYGGS